MRSGSGPAGVFPGMEPDERQCLRCGAPVDGVATRCGACGAPVATPGLEPVTVGEASGPDPRPGRLSQAATLPDRPAAPGADAARRRHLAPPAGAGGADYTLQGVIGQGGMGVVWAATQEGLGREVALKRLRPGAPRRTALQLLAEAQLTGALEHPGIVPVHEVGVDQDGLPFYTMRRLRGQTWSERWDELTLRQHIEVLLKVCDAVAYAHDRGVIHRDLKPANIFLGTYGEVVVFDWGLAVRVCELRQRPQPVLASGTPAYMAPEMARGDGRRIGPASDIYLLGAIIFEILTGQPPHSGDATVDVLLAAAENRLVADIPEGELGDIARRALAPDPDQRFPSVPALAQRLRVFLEHQDSIALGARAEARLASAESSDAYDDYARALHGFEDALALWPDNQAARRGLARARLAFAARARRAGDLDLAARLLLPDDPEHAEERMRIAVQVAQRQRRRRLLKTLQWLSALLGLSLLASLVLGYFLVRQERDRVIAIARERDAAEALLNRERQDELAAQRRLWRRVVQEDFGAPQLPREARVAGGRWAVAGGRLLAEGEAEALLALAVPVEDALVLQLDAEPGGVFALVIGDLTIEVAEGVAVRQRETALASAPLPPAAPALGRRLRLELADGRLRLLADGRTVIDRHGVAVRARELALRARPGSAFDNLKVEIPWDSPPR